jgi:hypothetical protein
MKEEKEKFTKKVTANVQNTQLGAVEDINEKRNKIKRGITETGRKIVKKECQIILEGKERTCFYHQLDAQLLYSVIYVLH